MKKRILVTGGAGFIGSHLIKKLINGKNVVVSIDNYSNGYVENHVDGAVYIKGETLDISNILKNENSFDVVYHFGEYSRIVPSFTQIHDVWMSNSLGTFNVLEYCKNTNVSKIIYAGSSTKFASEGTSHSPYAFTKSKSAELVKNYYKWYGLNFSICYFYNVFGNRNINKNDKYESVISVFANQYKSNLPLTVCGNGKQRRTFTYIDDIICGLIKATEYNGNEEFQLNDTKEFTILEIANMFSDNIIYLPQRPGDRHCSITTDNKARELLDWDVTMSIDTWINNIINDSK